MGSKRCVASPIKIVNFNKNDCLLVGREAQVFVFLFDKRRLLKIHSIEIACEQRVEFGVSGAERGGARRRRGFVGSIGESIEQCIDEIHRYPILLLLLLLSIIILLWLIGAENIASQFASIVECNV
jgi:hypothetical protein